MTNRELYSQINCIATANGYTSARAFLNAYYAEHAPPPDALWCCPECDVWLKEPERNEQGIAVCEAGHQMNQSPF
jgi:hypothetical protein